MEPNDETARAVRAAMDNYLAAINAADLPLAVKSYGSPITLLSGEGATVFETQEAYLAMLDALFAGLRARGFARTAWRKVVVIPMGPGLALASCSFDRYHRDGSVLESGAATYTLHERDGAWRIAAVLTHPIDQLLSTGTSNLSI